MAELLAICFKAHEAFPLAGLAAKLGKSFDLLLLTGAVPQGHGAERIFTAELQEIPPADGIGSPLATFSKPYRYIVAASSMQSKDVLGRLAGLLDASMITDVISVDSATQFKRPILAGAVIAVVEVLEFPVVITARTAGFAAPESQPDSPVEAISVAVATMSRLVSRNARSGSRPDLTQARVVVTGGRPLKNSATFESVIGGLADALGGAVGATRAAVDSGIAPNELQVGQTGKIVAPDLYIAAGVSGSTQHMAGIKDSKLIVAINKDPEAPIFEVADLGLVADLFDALPELQKKLTP